MRADSQRPGASCSQTTGDDRLRHGQPEDIGERIARHAPTIAHERGGEQGSESRDVYPSTAAMLTLLRCGSPISRRDRPSLGRCRPKRCRAKHRAAACRRRSLARRPRARPSRGAREQRPWPSRSASSTRVTDEGDQCWVIQDSGSGIAREEPAMFGRPHCSRREGGSGLGVAIARLAISRAGGLLCVESEPGAGTPLHAARSAG